MSALFDTEYSRALQLGIEKINNNTGTAVAFHSVLDGFLRLDQNKIEKIIEAAGLDQTILAEEIPPEIHTPLDFIKGLLFSLKHGKALQLMVRSADTFRWMKEYACYDQLRLGGTSANMASTLCQIGLSKVIVYANPLTRQLAELFPPVDNLYVFTERDGAPRLSHPQQAWKNEGIFAVHWIFDFPAGLRVKVGDEVFTTPRANRFIAAWNPINNQLELDPIFTKGVLEHARGISHFLLSGYHIISESYPDGTKFENYIKPTVKFVDQLKAVNQQIKIHLELASIASSAIRKYLVEQVLPRVDSVGINEIELAMLLNDLGEDGIAQDIMDNKIEGFFEGAVRVVEKTKISRFHGHNLGYYLVITDKAYASPEEVKNGLFFAATVAAARTKDGYLTQQNWRNGLNVPIKERDLKEMSRLDNYLQAKGYQKRGDLSWESAHHWIVAIPARVVEQPVLTVGLGDIISASAFLTT